MRILPFILFACAVTPTCAQQLDPPKDGNELLDSCIAMVDTADSPASLSSLSSNRVTQQMMKSGWCLGYLQAMQDAISVTQINLAIIAISGVKFSGPDKEKEHALEMLRVACIPGQATILQLGRVLVKWLHEHPEKLHEPKTVLAMAALGEAFPCEQSATKEAPKPTPPKP